MNPRRPTPAGPQPAPFDLARAPPRLSGFTWQRGPGFIKNCPGFIIVYKGALSSPLLACVVLAVRFLLAVPDAPKVLEDRSLSREG